MKYLPFIFVYFLTAAFYTGCNSPASEEIGETEMEVPANECLAEVKITYADTIPRPGNPSAPLTDYRDSLDRYFNDSNYIQLAAAEQLGINPINTMGDVYLTRRPLTEIASSDNSKVDNLTHSLPFLVPEAAALLDDIGSEFTKRAKEATGIDGYKVIMTSALRTASTVKALMKVNQNAVEKSTHMYGTTFDISYNGFMGPGNEAVSSPQLKMVLAEVLRDMRAKERCYVKYEIKSPCFHITATK